MIEPKITVVTIVYNAKDELSCTVESIRKQIYSNIEYVIVDGGSDDGTTEVIQSNLDVVSTWVSEKDQGIYDAMNKGWHLATGDYVIFMNAGDQFYRGETLAGVARYLTGSDVVYGDCVVVGSRRSDGLRKSLPINSISKGMVCSHQSMFFKRALIEHTSYKQDFGTAGDYELICNLYSSGFHFTKANIVVSVYGAGGVSDTNRLSSIYNSVKALKCNGMLGSSQVLVWGWYGFRECLKGGVVGKWFHFSK